MKTLSCWAAMAVAVALGVSWQRPAAAQWAFALEGAEVKNRAGGALDGRFGYRTGLPREFILHTIILQFEAIGGYQRMPIGPDGLLASRFGGGLRVGLPVGRFIAGGLEQLCDDCWVTRLIGDFFSPLEPFVYGHLSAADAQGGWGTLSDLGAALDVRASGFSVGAHYDREIIHVPGEEASLDELGVHLEVRGYWF